MPSDQAAGPAVETAGPVEDWRRAVGSLREAAKWIVVAFAGVGAAILGVLPVVGVSKLDTAPSIGLAVAGALLAVAGVAIGVWATSDVLTPHVSTLKSVGARPDVVAAVNDDPATYLGAAGVTVDAFAEDLSGWQRTLRELREQRGPDTHAEKLRQDALGIARLNVENRAVIARQVVAFGHFQLVRALFRRARIIMFWAFAMVALGVGLFVAGTVVASGDNGDSGGTVANLGYPASIRLAFSDVGPGHDQASVTLAPPGRGGFRPGATMSAFSTAWPQGVRAAVLTKDERAEVKATLESALAVRGQPRLLLPAIFPAKADHEPIMVGTGSLEPPVLTYAAAASRG